jgi:hypothetical protein
MDFYNAPSATINGNIAITPSVANFVNVPTVIWGNNPNITPNPPQGSPPPFSTFRKMGQAGATIKRPLSVGLSQASIKRYNFFLQDTASRFQSSGWGIPDVGPPWSNYNPDSSIFSVNSSDLVVNLSSITNADISSIIDSADFQASAQFRTTNTTSFSIAIDGRLTPAPSSDTGSALVGVATQVQAKYTAGVLALSWNNFSLGTSGVATYNPAFAFTANTRYQIMLLTAGADIFAKVWDISAQPEPPWQVQIGTSGVLTDGFFAIELIGSGAIVNLDNLNVVDFSTTNNSFTGLAQARIVGIKQAFAQAGAFIIRKLSFAQAQANIHTATTDIGGTPLGDSSTGGDPSLTGGQGFIGSENIATPAQQYIARYNGYRLPGYVQDQSWSADNTVDSKYGNYDGSAIGEYTGQANVILTVKMKVIGDTYRINKDQVQMAGTILRTNNKQFVPLYVQRNDRYWEALAKTISYQTEAAASNKSLEYIVTFECRPWLTSTTTTILKGTGLLDTDQVGRTILNGGWTPAVITVVGTNITVSGYTANGDFTGYIEIPSTVSGMTINTLDYTARMDGKNRNDLINNLDYELFVGPSKTYFEVDGATDCTIQYNDRWYL